MDQWKSFLLQMFETLLYPCKILLFFWDQVLLNVLNWLSRIQISLNIWRDCNETVLPIKLAIGRHKNQKNRASEMRRYSLRYVWILSVVYYGAFTSFMPWYGNIPYNVKCTYINDVHIIFCTWHDISMTCSNHSCGKVTGSVGQMEFINDVQYILWKSCM